MGLIERLNEAAKSLPEPDLAEVVGLAEALQSHHARPKLTLPGKVVDTELMRQVRSLCPANLIWNREELYGRGLR